MEGRRKGRGREGGSSKEKVKQEGGGEERRGKAVMEKMKGGKEKNEIRKVNLGNEFPEDLSTGARMAKHSLRSSVSR